MVLNVNGARLKFDVKSRCYDNCPVIAANSDNLSKVFYIVVVLSFLKTNPEKNSECLPIIIFVGFTTVCPDSCPTGKLPFQNTISV